MLFGSYISYLFEIFWIADILIFSILMAIFSYQRLKFSFVDLNQWFSTGDEFAHQVTCGNSWRCSWLSYLGWWSHWHLEGRDHENSLTPYNAQGSPPTTKHYLAQHVSSVKVEKLQSKDKINVNKILEKIRIRALLFKSVSIMSV